MAYLGNDLQVAFPTYRNIDDISGSFNGVTTSFPLTVAGVAPIPAPINSQQCLISVNGVVQRPDDSGTEGFRLSGGNIIFASAPAGGVDFFGVILAGADYVNIGANFPSGTAVAPSITFDSDLDTGIYNPAGNQIGFATSGIERLVINSSGQVSGGLGTAATPVISFISDPNTGIYSPGADQVAISTGGSGRLFVKNDGSVAVGAPTGDAVLEIGFGATANRAAYIDLTGDTTYADYGLRVFRDSSGANAASQLFHRGTGDFAVNTLEAAPFIVRTNNTERARIDSSGRLLVGTSSAQGNGRIQVQGSNVESKLTMWRDNAPFGFIDGTAGSSIEFGASPSSGVFGIGASIQFFGDQTWGSNDYPGRLVFSTTADGASSPTERLRIDSSGRVGVGTTSPGAELNIVKNLSGGLGAQLIVENQFGNAGSEAAILCRTNLVCKAGLHVVADDGGTGTGNGNYLYFTTTPGGSTTESERARIDSSGRLLVGTSSGSYKFQINALGSVGFAFDDTVAAIAGTFGTGGNLTLRAQVVSSVGGGEIYLGGSTRGDSNINSIVLSTSNTERMRIDSSGRVGIGTSPGYPLDVVSNVSAWGLNIRGRSADNIGYIRLSSNDGATTYAAIGTPAANTLGFDVNGSERARIDSSGRLLVGTSSARTNINSSVAPVLQVEGTSQNASSLSLTRSDASTSSNPPFIFLTSTGGTTVGSNALVVNNTLDTYFGAISFCGTDGTKPVVAAQIDARLDGTPGANDMPGRLVFSTTADGASSPTERMRITSGGYFKASNTGVYTDSAGGSRAASTQHFFRNDVNALNVQATSMSTGSAVEGFTSDFVTGANGKHFIGAVNLVRTFIVDANGDVTNTNNSYGAISDVKLKENIIDANSQWDDLKALRVCNYNFKTGESTHTQIGLIAQEVELVSPGLVSESPDLDADGNELGTVTKSVNYSVLYMKAVKALQEAMERIETLEAKVAALETP